MEYIESAYAVIFNQERDRILGVMPEWDRNMVLLPGGMRESIESLERCMLREVSEEVSGIQIIRHQYFRFYDVGKALYHDKNLRIHVFLTETAGIPQPSSEIINKVWVPEDNYFEKGIKLASVFGWLIPDLVYEGYMPEEILYKPIVTTFNPTSPSQPQDSSAH